ncbi:hypothetical protein [Rhizosphaericola mali]|uniref:Uncharacterized protein n=1 Tax=Rhizosphaericola mali TaxID=2545455 RepID=A0A5P2FW46_9BACT|nr:hypothetical protein [Rhizosphaericola mali]QES87385.1 hypothetical protein E0W69_001485 [Rhizosphaericola mali]
MQYISPIRFFNHCEIPIEELSQPAILKKRIQAEFALESIGIVTIEDFSYNKQDILTEIEQPNFLQRLDFHEKIWQEPALLQLIEKGRIDFSTFQSLHNVQVTFDFVRFISPYMIIPFDKTMKILLSNGNFKDATTWLSVQKFMEKEDLFDAFQSFTFFCEKSFFQFRNISRDNYLSKLEIIDIWTNKDQNWATFFNTLPEFLIEYREEISHGLTHLIVELQFPNIKKAFAISKMLTTLNVSPTQEELIKKNNEIIKKHYRQENKPAIFSDRSIRFWLFGGFILIRVIYWMVQNNQSTNSYENNRMTFPTTQTHNTIDSILEKAKTKNDSTFNPLKLGKDK